MNATLTKALEGLDLQPGQTYLATVNGHEVEVRVLGDEDVPTPEFADRVMLLPWVEFPFPSGGGTAIARPGPLPLPDPPVIPEDYEETTE